MMRIWGKRGLTLLMVAALWLPSLDAVFHGALSSHQWLRHAESTAGCHAERCVLGLALAERALVADTSIPVPQARSTAFAEPLDVRENPLPQRSHTPTLPRSPPA